jgi:hypothetical protein
MRQMVVQLGKMAAEQRHELEILKLKREVDALKEKRAFYKAYIKQQKGGKR